MRVSVIPILLLCFLLVVPVFAVTDYTFTAPAGKAIWNIDFNTPADSSGSITVTQEDGNTTTCTWSYVSTSTLLFLHGAHAETTVPGDSSVYDYSTNGNLYMEVQVQGETVLSGPMIRFASGQVAPAWNKIIATDIGGSPVLMYHLVSDTEIQQPTQTLIDYDVAVNEVSLGLNNWIFKIMQKAYEVFDSGIDFITNLLYWLKFFFVDHLLLIIGLYISVSMALAARAARGNIGRFFRVFIREQKSLFGFIMELWRMLLESIGTVRGWFRI